MKLKSGKLYRFINPPRAEWGSDRMPGARLEKGRWSLDYTREVPAGNDPIMLYVGYANGRQWAVVVIGDQLAMVTARSLKEA